MRVSLFSPLAGFRYKRKARDVYFYLIFLSTIREKNQSFNIYQRATFFPYFSSKVCLTFTFFFIVVKFWKFK